MILQFLPWHELELLDPRKLRKRIRQAREQLNDRAVDSLSNSPDLPTARKRLHDAAYMLADAETAARRRGIKIPPY